MIFWHAPAWVTVHAGGPLEVPVAALHYYGLEYASAILAKTKSEHEEQVAAIIERHRAREAATRRVEAARLELTGDSRMVEVWLDAPHPVLNDASPRELLESDEFMVVDDPVDDLLSGAPA